MIKRSMIAAALVLAAGTAQSATINTFTNTTTFDAAVIGASGSVLFEDFNSFTSDISLENGPVNVPTVNPKFTVEAPNSGQSGQNKIDAPGFSPDHSIDGTTYVDARLRRPQNSANEFLRIVFPQPVFAFGADFAAIEEQGNTGTARHQIGLSVNVPGGPQITNLPSTFLAGFFGIVSDEAFSIVQVEILGNNSEDRIGMDNFRYAEFTTVIPLPVTLPMFLGALALLGFMTRRRVAA